MRVSARFINFAKGLCIAALPLLVCACKGRTINNMEPTGDTVEVVIIPPVSEVNNQQTNIE